jgi:hypothetical protein
VRGASEEIAVVKRKQIGLDAALANRLQHAAKVEGTELPDFTRRLLLWALSHYHTASSLWLLRQAEVIVPKLTLPKKSRKP